MSNSTNIKYRDIDMDMVQRVVKVNNKEIPLTNQELKILYTFLANPKTGNQQRATA